MLGSNGSVVPLFREQIAAGGPITLTDERMTRYFMSIHEAAELIVQAGALSEGGDIFLLDMGEPMLIHDLAENMVRLAGLSRALRGQAARATSRSSVIGVRPGEKLFEELFYDPANAEPTRAPEDPARADGPRTRTPVSPRRSPNSRLPLTARTRRRFAAVSSTGRFEPGCAAPVARPTQVDG